MKTKLFNNLLLFSLFGVALGFFGILYEGLVYGPKFLDTSMDRMLFWKSFTSIISPLAYYTPWVGLGTLILVALFFKTPKLKPLLKNRLKWASIFQVLSLAITLFILTQINFKQSFSDIAKYADVIPGKVILFNILSVLRIVLVAIALISLFKAYIQTQKEAI
ncbi:MAG TPA: hypothetical protein VK808_00090 [Bacteroidia bacterium]|nr:hypothetical protein [Bacteroidia bacterium]